jgi:hypothetical protein
MDIGPPPQAIIANERKIAKKRSGTVLGIKPSKRGAGEPPRMWARVGRSLFTEILAHPCSFLDAGRGERVAHSNLARAEVIATNSTTKKSKPPAIRAAAFSARTDSDCDFDWSRHRTTVAESNSNAVSTEAKKSGAPRPPGGC